jgi:hypothetical protein
MASITGTIAEKLGVARNDAEAETMRLRRIGGRQAGHPCPREVGMPAAHQRHVQSDLGHNHEKDGGLRQLVAFTDKPVILVEARKQTSIQEVVPLQNSTNRAQLPRRGCSALEQVGSSKQ